MDKSLSYPANLAGALTGEDVHIIDTEFITEFCNVYCESIPAYFEEEFGKWVLEGGDAKEIITTACIDTLCLQFGAVSHSDMHDPGAESWDDYCKSFWEHLKLDKLITGYLDNEGLELNGYFNSYILESALYMLFCFRKERHRELILDLAVERADGSMITPELISCCAHTLKLGRYSHV